MEKVLSPFSDALGVMAPLNLPQLKLQKNVSTKFFG